LGRIASIELNHKAVDTAKRGESVAMKIEATTPNEATRLYGRHFDHNVRGAPCPLWSACCVETRGYGRMAPAPAVCLSRPCLAEEGRSV
jgi:hypothetical protein